MMIAFDCQTTTVEDTSWICGNTMGSLHLGHIAADQIKIPACVVLISFIICNYQINKFVIQITLYDYHFNNTQNKNNKMDSQQLQQNPQKIQVQKLINKTEIVGQQLLSSNTIGSNNMSETASKKYQPLIISGCSGVGKGTLIKYLLQKYPTLFELSVSLTTRKPRPGQLDGREYYFMDKEHFQKEIKDDVFAEYCEVHGNYYGTHQRKLEEIINKGKICLLDIDLQGGQKIQKKLPGYNYLFIDPPSFETLQQRLHQRGTQTEQQIQKRLKNAKGQLETIKGLAYYNHLINGQLLETERNLIKFINEKYGLMLDF